MHAFVIFNLFIKSLTPQFWSVTEFLYTRIMCSTSNCLVGEYPFCKYKFRVTYIAGWDLPGAEMKIQRKLNTTKIQKYIYA